MCSGLYCATLQPCRRACSTRKFPCSMGGSRWTRQDNWGSTAALDSWWGVACTQSRVSSLDLDRNRLSGDLAAGLTALAPLTALNALSLSNNQLRGSAGNLVAFPSLASLSL